MLIKLLTSRAGPTGVDNFGDEIEVDAAEGKRMIDAGQAELVRAKEPEKAVKRAKVEKAAK